MKVQINSTNLQLSQKTKEYIECKILFGLSRFQDSIKKVEVHLKDLQNYSGNSDKQCTINLEGKDNQSVTISGHSENLFSIIDRCLTRARYRFLRKIQSRQSIKKITQGLGA